MVSFPESLQVLLDETVVRIVLPNGLTVVHKEIPDSPVFSAQVFIKTGSIHEGAMVGCGVSHFVEHMCFKGTARRTFREITRDVQAVGGISNANTSFERTVYFINCPPEHHETALDVLEDTVFHSLIPEAEFPGERDVILREIDMVTDDPDWTVAIRTLEEVFRVNPVRYPIIGYKELFETITREELFAYYGARYRPNNAVLATAGAVNTQALLESIERRFGGLRRGRGETLVPPGEPLQSGFRSARITGDYNITRGVVALPIPGPQSPAFPVVRVLADVLGGGEASRLWTELRNRRGLVHSVEASPFRLGGDALLWVSYTCDPGKEEAADSAVREILAGLASDLPGQEEIDALKQKALTSEIKARQRASTEAGRIGSAEAVLGDLDLPRVQLERLWRTVPDDLGEIATDWLRAERMTAIRLGPEGAGATRSRRSLTAPAEVKVTPLPGGARLVEYPDDRLPFFNLRAVWRGGVVGDPEGKAGLGALATILRTKDAGGLSAGEIARRIESIGGSMTDVSGNLSNGLSLGFQTDHLEDALGFLGSAMNAVDPTEETFRVERDALIAELREDLDEPLRYGLQHLRAAFFNGHRFGNGPQGNLETLDRMEIADVREWLRQGPGAGGLVFAVAGRYDRDALREGLTGILEHRRSTGGGANGIVVDDSVPAVTHAGETRETLQRDQAVVFDTFPISGMLDSDFAVGEVVDQLFSGMASRLFEEVRERRGLAYYISAHRLIGTHHGCLTLYSGCHPGKVDAVFGEFEREIERLRTEGPDEKELRDVRERLIAGKRMGLESLAAKASELSLSLLYNRPADLGADYIESVSRVEVSDVRNWVAQYLVPERRFRYAVLGRGD